MSSADRWRVGLDSSISRIFTRGSVTFRPALRRSLVSKLEIGAQERRWRRGCFEYYAPSFFAPDSMTRLLAALCLCLALPACGLVYKLPTRQGNVMEQKQLDH